MVLKKYIHALLPARKAILLSAMVLTIAAIALSFEKDPGYHAKGYPKIGPDSLVSKKAFLQVYKVLMSPRCMNCHPSGDAPLQGDDSHVHTMGVLRGPDGTGLYALKCANCHQAVNTPGRGMPPGNPKWHLPPANMKMVFQGRTPRELAAQLLDPAKNGGKTKEQLIRHISSDTLVLAGWKPAEGLSLPPLGHAEFTKEFKLWIGKGAYLPDK